MPLQHYNSNDLTVRTAVAACAIGCKAAGLAKKWRYGSITRCEQKGLEIVVAQINIIRTFTIIELPAITKIIVSSDGGTNVASVIKIDGVTISNSFLYTTDNTTTAGVITTAINNYTSTPNYTATSNGAVVTVTAVTKGYSGNNKAVTQVGGDVVISAQFTNGGQDGVDPEDNIVTEAQLEHMFNNIATFTGCCYAPLGYGYETPPSVDPVYMTIMLNDGNELGLNSGEAVALNEII